MTNERRKRARETLHRLLTDAARLKNYDWRAAARLARHVRRAWQHVIFDRWPEASPELQLAELEFQRLNGMALGEIAGEALLRKQRMRPVQSGNASHARRTDVTAEQLDAIRNQFFAMHGTEWGWKSFACRKLDLDRKTLNKIIGD